MTADDSFYIWEEEIYGEESCLSDDDRELWMAGFDYNKKMKDHDHLRDVIGSLMIAQFKGDDKQDQYRAVINTIFAELNPNSNEENQNV